MSRRRSRLPPPVGSDRELIVDKFLNELAAQTLRTFRTSRTPRNKRISANDAPPPQGQKHYSNLIGEEDDFILETLAAVEREESTKKEPIGRLSAKSLKSPKRTSSGDTEWGHSMVNEKSFTSSKKRRRKHYVVLNSLPLAQDLRNDRFQFTQPTSNHINHTLASKDNNKMAQMGNIKPLFPVSAIRSMITSPWFKKELNPTRLSNKSGCTERAVPRTKPGSGFDWVDGGGEISPLGSGVLESVRPAYLTHSACAHAKEEVGSTISLKHKILPLPSVPETASPIMAEFKMKSMAEHSNLNSIELEVLAKQGKPDGYAVVSENPLSAYASMKTKYPGRRVSGNLGAKTNAMRSSPTLGDQEPELPAQSDSRTCQSLKENWCSRVSVAPGVVEIKKISHDTSQISSTRLNGSLPAFTHASPRRRQTEFETRALRSPPLVESSPKSASVSILSNALGRVNTEFEEGRLSTPSPVENTSKRSHVHGRQRPPTYPYLPAKIVLADEVEDEGDGNGDRNGDRNGDGSDDDDEDEDRNKEGLAFSISQCLSINRSPQCSYFSTAQRVLGDNLGRGAKFPPMGYPHRSVLETQYFPIVSDVDQDTGGYENLVANSTIPNGIYNLNYKKLSTPNRGPTTSVALKDLLSRMGGYTKRQPSISGIFRGRKSSLANLEPSGSNYQGPMELTLVHATDVQAAITSGPHLSSNTSAPETAYTPETIPKSLCPFVAPVGESLRGLVGNNKPRAPKLKRAIPPRPRRRTFKSPLLDVGENILFGNGFRETRTIKNRLRTKPPGEQIKLNVENPEIDIKRIASFVAVQEAW